MQISTLERSIDIHTKKAKQFKLNIYTPQETRTKLKHETKKLIRGIFLVIINLLLCFVICKCDDCNIRI